VYTRTLRSQFSGISFGGSGGTGGTNGTDRRGEGGGRAVGVRAAAGAGGAGQSASGRDPAAQRPRARLLAPEAAPQCAARRRGALDADRLPGWPADAVATVERSLAETVSG
jgi:hypothetical protein